MYSFTFTLSPNFALTFNNIMHTSTLIHDLFPSFHYTNLLCPSLLIVLMRLSSSPFYCGQYLHSASSVLNLLLYFDHCGQCLFYHLPQPDTVAYTSSSTQYCFVQLEYQTQYGNFNPPPCCHCPHHNHMLVHIVVICIIYSTIFAGLSTANHYLLARALGNFIGCVPFFRRWNMKW